MVASTDRPFLSMWTVYDHPLDFPDHFIARQWLISAGQVEATTNTIQSTDLEIVRGELRNMGKVALARNEHDDPKIVETWI